MNKHILVTGANGFVGTASCRRLQSEGCEVVAALRRSDRSFPVDGIRCLNVGHIDGQTDWTEAVDSIDIVVHLAARAHVVKDTQDKQIDAYRQVNVEGTRNLAESAERAGVKRLVFLSSVKVNGEGTDFAYTEMDPPSPNDPYGISKMEAEQALHAIADRSEMEIVILRPPLVYGPGVKANFLALMHLVARRIPLPLGSVNNSRSLIYLENLVDCISQCVGHPAAAGQTYLVSDDYDFSTPELIRSLASAMNKTAFLFPFPLGILQTMAKLMGKSGAAQRLLNSLTIDISKIKRELAWAPPISVTTGMLATASWFKERQER